jgi:hypothetical protein
MDAQPTDVQSALSQIRQILDTPFYYRWDFWISTVIGVIGAFIAYGAYTQAEKAEVEAKSAKLEAEKAKQAALEGGKTVKLQTVCIDLSQIAQKLGAAVQPGIKFAKAKELFNETSGHLLRVMAPFGEHSNFRAAIGTVKTAIQGTHDALQQVAPTDPAKENETPYAVYNGVEDQFATLKFAVDELSGLMEAQTYEFGKRDGER